MIVDTAATSEGFVERDGQRIAWQEFGSGDDVLLLLPTWSIVHSDFWSHQVPHFLPNHRVITFDGLGNGASDRPVEPRFYGDLRFADDAAAVLDARHVQRAAVMGTSQGGPWALALAGRHPERVSAAVFIAPNVPLAPGHAVRIAAHQRFDEVLAEHPDWARWNRHHWLNDFPDFLRFFFSQCFTEPDSDPQIEHFLAMGMQTTPEVLLATISADDSDLTSEAASRYARQLSCPSLVIHGSEDAIAPTARGEELARLAGSELIIMAGSGHEPQSRSPEVVNAHIDAFLASV